MNETEAREFCLQRGSAGVIERMERFISLLAEENARQNLVSSASLEQVWVRHIADSLQLIDHVPRETSPWLDLGTGAGFPGLAIAIALPHAEVVMVESRKRRVEFLDHVRTSLGLHKSRVVGSRLETAASFDAAVISARAFAPLDKLIDLSARFSTHSTVWLLPKGRTGAQELTAQSSAIQAMFHVERSATDPDAALLVGQGRPTTP
jgi:16S rRNA (guanine527-N7)-methyltransferase